MRKVETKVYKFEELSEDAKQNAIEWYRDKDDDFWYGNVIEDAKQIGAILGIDIDKIYFSGFWSQGDGACFTGEYHYKKGFRKALKEHAPANYEYKDAEGNIIKGHSESNAELEKIADALYEIQKRNFYQLSATVKHKGHYYNEYCTDVSVYDFRDGEPAQSETDEELTEVLRDFMRWIYRQLESEYEYQNSDEVITENIIVNEYEFTEDGKFYQ